MTDYSELRKTLQEHFDWHGARLSFLALFLLALIKVRTVNLSELALGFGGRALSASHDKRLQRFFRHFDLDYTDIAHIDGDIGLKLSALANKRLVGRLPVKLRS